MAGGRLWEAEEVAVVRRARRGEIQAVAHQLSRSVGAVAMMRWKLRRRRLARPWLPDEDALLLRVADEGGSIRGVAETLGRGWRAPYARLLVLRHGPRPRR